MPVGQKTVNEMLLLAVMEPDCPGARFALCRFRLGLGACAELDRTLMFAHYHEVLNRNPLAPRLSPLIKHVDKQSSDVSATYQPQYCCFNQ